MYLRHVNLLNTSKTSNMFRPPLVAIFREVVYDGYVTNTSKPMYRFKNIKFYIYRLKYFKI